MKVLLINGSPHEFGCTDAALRETEKVLSENGVKTELLWLGTAPVRGCIACGACRENGRCIFEDAVNRVIEALPEIDGLIIGSPVYYAGASGQITSFLDRLFYAAGGKMAGKPAAAVVSCRRGGATAAFEALNQYFMMSNMPIVTSQYWNQVHGTSPEEVAKDAEGLQTMRTLALNMVWLLRSIEAGRQAGIPYPVYEPKLHTNFIR